MVLNICDQWLWSLSVLWIPFSCWAPVDSECLVGDVKWLIEQRALKAQADVCSHSRVVRHQSFNITMEHCSRGDLNSWYYEWWETSFTVCQMTGHVFSRQTIRKAGGGQSHCELWGSVYDQTHVNHIQSMHACLTSLARIAESSTSCIGSTVAAVKQLALSCVHLLERLEFWHWVWREHLFSTTHHPHSGLRSLVQLVQSIRWEHSSISTWNTCREGSRGCR